jgi:hypothetical protein
MEHEQLKALFGRSAKIAADAEVRISTSTQETGALHKSVVFELEPEFGRLKVASTWSFADGTSRTFKRAFKRRRWDEDSLTEEAAWRLRQLLMNVLCFPAERAGLLLSVEADDAEFDLPPPLDDFLEIMWRMRTTRRKSPLKAELLPLLNRIVGGEIRLAGPKDDKQPILEVAGRKLHIAVASSLSRSVAGLAQYIQTLAAPGDVILIDELEMNAHPAAQLALVELMAVMVSYGIRIVFTTHSPYVIDHLNNLLEAGRAPEERREKLAEEFQLGTSRAFLPANKVSVYAFEETPDRSEVKVTNAMDPKSGLITKSTFAPVTQRLSQLFNAALDASEESA